METSSEERKLEIGSDTLKNLNTIRIWTTFLSVLGFILIGLFIIAGIVTGMFLTTFSTTKAALGIPESMVIILLFVAGAISLFPVVFLFRFSKNIRDAVQNNDQQKLDRGIRNLRKYFTFIGILVIIAITVYAAGLIYAGASISFLKGA
jgi:hypothetical protein